MHALLHSAPLRLKQATTDPCLCLRFWDPHGHVWVSFLWGHCSFLLGPVSQGFVCALPESVSPVLCKFWWFYGEVNGNLFQEVLSHTQVCYTKSPCSRPLLTHTFTGDTQTQCWLSFCGSGACSVPFPGLSSSRDQVLGI